MMFRPCFWCKNFDKVFAHGARYLSSSSAEATAVPVSEGTAAKSSPSKLSKVMQAYVERSKAYNEFIKKEEQLFNTGKRHLANMMGADPETFTQKDVDEAIEYLFPSGIYDKKARPFLKPPSEVFPPKKEAQFDESGRPFHFLFYTGRANFYNILYECVTRLNNLNTAEDALIRSKKEVKPVDLDVSGSRWLTKTELETVAVEEITNREYDQFLAAMERLLSHTLAHTQKEFIMKQRIPLMDVSKSFAVVEPMTREDGRQYVTTRECPRKSARATVTVIKPGTGKISINGKPIDYFETFQSRAQVSSYGG
ncbi:ribosomal protein, S9 [Nesidiocoris tenuis]|uniref:Ribosomal protein, S9 n=1 Tax=Nesidiocoris tenuis TaxID=355587 RepID=A0ABN7ASY1_9HEMI|nr:ribosomal protein, S9 [Nesidiocoris tenuis]